MIKRAATKSKDEHNIGVGILIFDASQTKILLGKRKNSFRSGTWGVPGGRVGKKELIEEAMKREIREETGIKPIQYKYLGVVREYQRENNGPFIFFFFKCTKYSGEVTNMEPKKCEGWVWHDLNKLPKNILNGHKLALKLLAQQGHFVDYVS